MGFLTFNTKTHYAMFPSVHSPCCLCPTFNLRELSMLISNNNNSDPSVKFGTGRWEIKRRAQKAIQRNLAELAGGSDAELGSLNRNRDLSGKKSLILVVEARLRFLAIATAMRLKFQMRNLHLQ
jgi:hypothetical protein